MEQVYLRKFQIVGAVSLSTLALLFAFLAIFSTSSPGAAIFAAPGEAIEDVDVTTVAITHTVGLDSTACPTARQITVAKGTDLYFCLVLKNTGTVSLTTFAITRVIQLPPETITEKYLLTFTLNAGEQITLTKKSLLELFKIDESFELLEIPVGADVDVSLTAKNDSASARATSDAKVDVVAVALKRGVGTTPPNCSEQEKIFVPVGMAVYHCYQIHNSGNVTVTVERIEDDLLDSAPMLNLQLGPGETITHGQLAGAIGEIVTTPTADGVHTATVYAAATASTIADITVSDTTTSSIRVLTETLYMPVLQTPSAFVEERALWVSQAITSYKMIERVSCFCPPPFEALLTIEGGEIISGVIPSTNEPLSADELRRFHSIDQLFDVIEEAESLPAAMLDVSIHPTLGIPVVVTIDYHAEIADDEISYSVTSFSPIVQPAEQ